MSFPRRFTTILSAVMFMGTALFSCGNKTSESSVTYPEMNVTFFDVGKADSILISTENSNVIIDCGEKGDGKEIVQFLEEKGVSTVDYLIVTHYDKDHVGGASKVIKSLDVKNVLAPDYEEISEETEKYEKALAGKNITPQRLTSDLSFDLDGASYTVYAPKETYYGEDNDNDFSLVTKMCYHDISFLFTGDAMEQRLDEIMDTGKCNLLKVPYHGRKLDNFKEFLQNIKPDCAIVCTSADEFSSKTEKALQELNIKTYATCYNGRITVSCNGVDLNVSTEK
ncbi:MAG: MBL fold metallo-hydrolase [Ruminococcus sp.]|nr:MBL fold metallo-hydrolase [Ruminococcus sp.]